MELVKIIDWIPKVWHHLNRFLEAHSSSDVTIGRWGARREQAGGSAVGRPWSVGLLGDCARALARIALCRHTSA